MSKRTERWNAIAERARETGHVLRVVLLEQDLKPGDHLVYSELAGEPTDDLDEAMTRTEAHLASPEHDRVSGLLAMRRVHKTRVEHYFKRMQDAMSDLARVDDELNDGDREHVLAARGRRAAESEPRFDGELGESRSYERDYQSTAPEPR